GGNPRRGAGIRLDPRVADLGAAPPRAARRDQREVVTTRHETARQIRDDGLRPADLRGPLVDGRDERRDEGDAHAQPIDVRDGMRLRNSCRTRSSSNAPDSALVVVRTPGFDTPRISMQKCRAWS